ncbi:hypothetical protein ACMFMG_001768 [Clarireedia jacksonii]
MAEEGRPQWEFCQTQQEKDRRTVFTMYKDIIMGLSIDAEQVEICVDVHYDRLKSLSNSLSRDSVVEICNELVRCGWFEPDSLARAFFTDLEKKKSKKRGHGLSSNDKRHASATSEPRKHFGIDPRDIIEIVDNDFEDDDDYRPEVSRARPADKNLGKRPGTSTRINQTSGRIQKSNEPAVPAHERNTSRGNRKTLAQLQASANKGGRSGRGEISRSVIRRDGTGIASNRSLNMSAMDRPGARPKRFSLADYYLDESDLPSMPFKIQHKIMTCMQSALEDIVFRFAKRWLPMILEGNNWDTPEACELSLWWICLRECKVPVEAVKPVKPSLQRLFDRLKHVRHCAVHRVPDIPIRSIQMMVADARLLAEALRDDNFVSTFTLWEDTLNKVHGLADRSRGQGRVVEAQRRFDSISRERAEVSKKTGDVQQNISTLRQDLSRLEQELKELRSKHITLCIQEDDAQRLLSAEKQASDWSLTIDDEVSHSAERVFSLPIRASGRQQEASKNNLSGQLVGLRDVGSIGHFHLVDRNTDPPLDLRLHNQGVKAGQTAGTTLPAASNTQVNLQAQAYGRSVGTIPASEPVNHGSMPSSVDYTGECQQIVQASRISSGSGLEITASNLEGKVVIDLTNTDEEDNDISNRESVIVARKSRKRSRQIGCSLTVAAGPPQATEGMSLKNEFSSADDEDDDENDANKSQSQGVDMGTPTNKKRKSGIACLQPVRETILGGVVEEMGDQDFVSFA